MDTLQKGTLTLIRSALTGNAYKLPEGFCIEDAAKMIQKHNIVGLAYEGAIKCGIDKSTPAMQELFQRYYGDIIRSDRQMKLLDKLFAAFQENNIDFLPLKGTILKSLYPQPGMRPMGDADILIRVEQYDRIKSVMAQLGFQEGKVTGHEFKKGGFGTWAGPKATAVACGHRHGLMAVAPGGSHHPQVAPQG